MRNNYRKIFITGVENSREVHSEQKGAMLRSSSQPVSLGQSPRLRTRVLNTVLLVFSINYMKKSERKFDNFNGNPFRICVISLLSSTYETYY